MLKGKKKPKSKAKAKAKPEPKPKNTPKTPNGKLIANVMEMRDIKGSYKDFVILSGSKLVDAHGSWDIFSPDGAPLGVEGVALVHKSNLSKLVGEKFASRFWNSKINTRVPPTQDESNKNAVRH